MAELIWYLEEEGYAITGRFDDAVWQAFASVDEVLAGVDALLIAAAQHSTPCDYADAGHFHDEERSAYLLPPPGCWLWEFDTSEVSAEVFAAPAPDMDN